MCEADSPHRITHVHMLATVIVLLLTYLTYYLPLPRLTTPTNPLLCLQNFSPSYSPCLEGSLRSVLSCCASDGHRECHVVLKPCGRKGKPLKLEDPKPKMIARSNALCPRFLRSSLVYGKPLPCRQRVAVFSSKSGKHTIFEKISQSPASTCWSLLSPSSSIIVRFIKLLA